MSSQARATLLTFAALLFVARAGLCGDVHRLLDEGATDDALALLVKSPGLRDSLNEFQETPLHVAAQCGRTEAVRWLLAHKANVNAVAYNDFTPLHLASNGEIARALIKAGADLDRKAAFGDTPLQYAAEEGRHDVVSAILDSGYKLDLRTAVMAKKRDVVRKMLRDDPTLARRATEGSGLSGCKTPLGCACFQRDKEIVQLLLDAGADVNEGTEMPNAGYSAATALSNAVWAGDKEIVQMLLKHGAKTDAAGGGKYFDSILDYARSNSSPGMLRLLETSSELGRRPGRAGVRAVVAADDWVVVKCLAGELRAMGKEVRTAYDGRQAMEEVEAFRPDVVLLGNRIAVLKGGGPVDVSDAANQLLLDIGRPVLDGYEAARRIRKQSRGRSLVLVALRMSGEQENKRKEAHAGFDAHLVVVDLSSDELEELFATVPRAAVPADPNGP